MIAPFRKKDILEIGKEYPPKGETEEFQTMVEEIKEELRELYPEGRTLRQAHAKMHGLLTAKFIVDPNLVPELKVGIFKEAKTFDTLIRLSNSNTLCQPDAKGDIRGMAIKVIGVPGEKLLTNESNALTQDFVLISNETFISRNVKQFSRTIKAVASGSKLRMLFFALNPLNWGVLARSMQAFIKPGSVLEIPYFSSTPYQFGDPNKAVKYICLPRNAKNVPVPDEPTADFLRYQMVHQLKREDKYFDFYIQFQEHARQMPIEDPTVKWNSDPHKVATIHIPAQDFDTDERTEYGENLSFTPWHSLPEHRPIGGFNRARRWVYEAVSEFRRERNQQPIFEPTDIGIPESSTKPKQMTKIDIIKQVFKSYGEGDIPSVLERMSDNIVWYEPGDPDNIPFSGVFTGKQGVLKMFGIEAELLTITSFEPKVFLENDTTVVVLGSDSAIVKKTQKSYATEFTMAFTISSNLITKVQVYMDTLAIANAFIEETQTGNS